MHIHAGAAQSTTDSTFFTTAGNTEASSKFSARERIKTGRGAALLNDNVLIILCMQK